MTKLIFSDLDDTLLYEWKIPEENLNAVREARKRGHYFVPCSGRPPFMMKEILKELDLTPDSATDDKGEYCVCFNGGMIKDLRNGEVLFSKGLSYEDVEILTAIAREQELCAMIFTEDDLCLLNPDPSEVSRKIRQRIPIIKQESYDTSIFLDKKVMKIMFVKDHGQEYLRALECRIAPEIRDRYAISYSSGRFMEFNQKGISKGEAVRFLAAHLGIPICDTIAIGDNYNDIEMIKAAGLGVCVASGEPDVKRISDYICDRTCQQCAVAEVLEKFASE